MTEELHGKKVAILATDGVERVELEEPRGALHGAGAETELVSLHTGQINARQMDIDPAGTFPVDKQVADAAVRDYDALLLPGGTMNPDQLRTDPDAVRFAREFMEAGKPVATICHGPWTLAEAGTLSGRRLTSWPSIRTDLRNAGAEVVDEEVVVDGRLISSRGPHDLPAFCNAVVREFTGALQPA
ncbi:type 1 glutamine amidotransferase domain-containing protein [Streptomyces diacarni]|uniref:type 1 glutamine amidotransferase domain-containing protein n=1 Tax=Streptomyces diacarni TaxID=2800381 RepID=UPI0033FB5F66